MVTPFMRTLKGMKLVSMVDDPYEDPLAGLCDELEKISVTGRSVVE